MNFNTLNKILSEGTLEELNQFCSDHNLEIRDGKIYPKDPVAVKKQVSYWDKRQLVKKINLNS